MRKLAFFSALCFFLSAVEYAIPKPMPFFRIGIANLPIMISFLCMKKSESAVLIFLKVLLQGIVSGTLFSYVFLFSLAGSVFAGFTMMAVFSLFYKSNLVSWIGISMAGALVNNFSQLGIAYIFLFGQNIKFIAPILLIISFFTSIAMGIFANSFVKKSNCLKNLIYDNLEFKEENSFCSLNQIEKSPQPLIFFKAFILLLVFFVLFFSKTLYIILSIFFISYFLCLLKKKKVKLFSSLLIIISVTFFSMLIPHGKIIFEFWNIKITEGAIIFGLERALKLCSCVFISKLITHKSMQFSFKLGFFMRMVFEYFDKLSDKKTFEKMSLKNLVELIDKKLESVYLNKD